ncbi:MAG: DUF441 family protein, partial [Bacillota bacterium]|nr:DUF441 family protein [Bacillota bacterium]
MTAELTLVALLLIGIVAKSHLIAASACILIFLKLANLGNAFRFLESKGLEIGLLFLLLAIMT